MKLPAAARLPILFSILHAALAPGQQPALIPVPVVPAPGAVAAPSVSAAPGAEPATASTTQQARTELNLAGQTDTARGEARRNENVQVNLVDTNAARELNRRVGVSATLFDEFRSDRGYFGSEFGNPARLPIHAAAQSGANFHGNVFWSHNNSIFSARSFFQVGAVKPARTNQYGAAFGLGLWRGGFFTFNGSQEKNRGSVNGNVLIPLPEERTALATDPATRLLVQKALDGYPNVLPNRPDIAARALNTNSPQTIDTDSATGQFSQKLRPREVLSARYAFTAQAVEAFQFIRGSNPNTRNRSHTTRLSWNRALGSRTVLDASIGFDRQNVVLSPTKDAPVTTLVTGLSLLGPNPTIPLDRAQNRYRYAFSASNVRGRHTITTGAAVSRAQYNGYEDETSLGIFQYRADFGRDSITNLRLGTASTYTQALGTTYRAFRNTELQAYVGDRWVVNSKLTLNYSVHFEPITHPVDVSGRTSPRFDSDWNNVAPAFGLSWRMPRNAGVLRAAYGVMFGQIFPATFGMERWNAPFSPRVLLQAPNLVNPLAGVDFRSLGTATTNFVVSPDLATPYSQQYNLIWERDLARNWKLQMGYVGSRSVKLFSAFLLNRGQPMAGVPLTTATINQRRADQSKLEVDFLSNANRGYYDAGRITLIVPRWRRMTLNASYWFSKAIDTGTDYNSTGAALDARRAGAQYEFSSHPDLRSLSAFDQPHALLIQANYDLPRTAASWSAPFTRNWSVNVVALRKNGTPFTVDSGSDGPGIGNVDGTVGDRVMILDPSILGRTIGNPDTSQRLLPRSAFRFIDAPKELAGNIGRNVFRRGGIANVNMAVSRDFKLARDWGMNLRAESINLFNTPQFAEPGFSLSATNFGQISNTLNDGRTFRFALRLTF